MPRLVLCNKKNEEDFNIYLCSDMKKYQREYYLNITKPTIKEKKYLCEACQKQLCVINKYHHERSKRHLINQLLMNTDSDLREKINQII
jgi:hypothetical protein